MINTVENNKTPSDLFAEECQRLIVDVSQLVNNQPCSEDDKCRLRAKILTRLQEMQVVLVQHDVPPATLEPPATTPVVACDELATPALASVAIEGAASVDQCLSSESVVLDIQADAPTAAELPIPAAVPVVDVSPVADVSEPESVAVESCAAISAESVEPIEQIEPVEPNRLSKVAEIVEIAELQSMDSMESSPVATTEPLEPSPIIAEPVVEDSESPTILPVTQITAVDTPAPHSLQEKIDQLQAELDRLHAEKLLVAPQKSALKPGHIPSPSTSPMQPIMQYVSFKIPNAKVDEHYTAKIEALDLKAPITIRDLKLASEHGSELATIGLQFDHITQEISGKPTRDGEQAIRFQWSTDGKIWQSGDCQFFINPDPKTLWKVLEPSPDAPYYKTNLDSKTVLAPTHRMIAASRRGRSHEHAGTFRDDDFHIAHNPQTGWSLILVADGAGSAKSSREGSKIAVNTFNDYVQQQLTGERGSALVSSIEGWRNGEGTAGADVGKIFHYLFYEAAREAINAIEREAQSQNAAVKDYSTTLLAAVTRQVGQETFIATFWMGDGAIAVYGPHNTVRVMGTPDGGEFAGQTRFLDKAALQDTEFGKRINIGCYTNYDAIVLMTDGVSDPRFETDAGLVKPQLWDELWDELKPLLESDQAEIKLLDWLHFFKVGHHDDRTLALLVPQLENIEQPTP